MIGDPIGYPIGAGLVSNGTLVIATIGASDGVATVSGAIKGIIEFAGSASGTSDAEGVGASNATTGEALGSSTASAIGGAITHARGISSGLASVLGVSDIIVTEFATGNTQGLATATGVSKVRTNRFIARIVEGGAAYGRSSQLVGPITRISVGGARH